MAPIPPLGRNTAMAWVREGRMGFDFGSPHPCVMILEQDGMFRIRELVSDTTAMMREMEAARAAGRSFQPEHAAALSRPTGKIYAEAKTRDELLAIMSAMEWPAHW